jgi:acyl-CoA thioesterase-1
MPVRRWMRPILMALQIPLLAMPVQFAAVRAKAAVPSGRAEAPGRDRRGSPSAAKAMLPRVETIRQHNLPLRVVAFGSSSTEGVGASKPSLTYPSLLAVELTTLLPHEKVTVINRGVGGNDAEDLARRVPEVLADRPDLVIFQTGTNDPLRALPLDRFVALTRQTIMAMQHADIDVMLMEPQLCHVTMTVPTAVHYRDALRRLGADMGLPVVRRWDLMRGWLDHDLVDAAQLYAPDGLHMADGGYALLAKAVARQVLTDSAPLPGTGVAANAP